MPRGDHLRQAFREYSAVERLTGRPVRLLLVVDEVMQKKSTEDIQGFLAVTGKVSSLPNATPLLRAEMLASGGLLLAYEVTGVTPAEYFKDPNNRTFDKASSFLIKTAALLIRLSVLGITHGEVSNENVVIEPSGEASVRGAGFQTFASLTGDNPRMPSDACPPELLMGGHVGNAIGAYGLGSLAYIAFSGRRWTDGFANVVDAVLTQDPQQFQPSDLPEDAWGLTKRLLEKDPERRFADLESVARSLNVSRLASGLSAVMTGLQVIDEVHPPTVVNEAEWGDTSATFDGAIKLDHEAADMGVVLESARDADDRALTVREVASGRRPKVVTVHRSKNAASESRERERGSIESRARDIASLEEWRPETMGDAWTVPVEDVAAIVICINGHRVSMGSLFCNFCGVDLTEIDDKTTTEDFHQCPNGHEVAITAAFCGKCGLSIESALAPASRETEVVEPISIDAGSRYRCLAGHPNSSDTLPCSTCGARIIGAPSVAPGVAWTPTAEPEVLTPVDEPRLVPVLDELDTAVCVVGHPNTASASFCRECGQRIVTEVRAEISHEADDDLAADLIFCTNDHPNRAFARFCRWCAEPLGTAVPTPTATPHIAAPVVVAPTTSPGLPGRPFLASATPGSSGGDVSVIFDQGHVAPAREEANVIRALSRRQEEVRPQKKNVVEAVHHAPKIAEDEEENS